MGPQKADLVCKNATLTPHPLPIIKESHFQRPRLGRARPGQAGPGDRPIDRQADRPADRPTTRPTVTPSGWPTDTPTDQLADR